MSRRDRGPGPLPNLWLHCPRKSDEIIAERFIAFKTPLSEAFESQMPMECIFLPKMIFDYCKTVKMKLGLWIDLTNTKRFYDRSTVENFGAKYIKLQCRGHGETPSAEQTHAFIEIVDQFIHEHPLEMIGVHCTHGFNRTGFLIVSYMVERLDCSLEAALMVFAKSRPPGIYKQDYINELFRRYESEEDAVSAPEKPDWDAEYVERNGLMDLNGDGDGDGGGGGDDDYHDNHASSSHQAALALAAAATSTDDGGGDGGDNDNNDNNEENGDGGPPNKKKRRREMIVKNAAFMEGVPGVRQVTDQPRLGDLQLMAQQWCKWSKNGFPGAQPVSMDRKNIKRLHEIPYRVSWKADGTRYMMLIHKRDEIYFFDRNHSCFQVENLTFPRAKNLHEHLENTLLDGEMVLDKIGNVVTPRYLVYDIVRLNDQDVGDEFFYPKRLELIRKEVIDARYEAIMQGILNRNLEPFSVRNKEFWDIRFAKKLLGEKFSKSLTHEPDGLIFQPSQQPYTAGQCFDVFKWKPHELNSVDFRLKIITDSGMGLLTRKIGALFVGGHDQPFGVLQKLTKDVRLLDNKIVECTMNSYGNWDFMRERTDKKMPNSYNTAISVQESIRNPITKDWLLSYIANYAYQDDHSIMPPPPQQQQQRRN